MQKYRLVYETDAEQIDIFLKGKDNEYTNDLELCFIDTFTTVYKNQNECAQYLYNKGIINSLNGKLYIKRSKGEVEATQIFYSDGNNSDIRTLSLEVCKKLRLNTKGTLSETKEYKRCVGEIIRFFYDNEEAFSILNKSFYTSKSFLNSFDKYLAYKNHSSFYIPEETNDREKLRKNIYNILKNYDIMRELKMWIDNYQTGFRKGTSSGLWKNPFEEYEKRKDEMESRNQNL